MKAYDKVRVGTSCYPSFQRPNKKVMSCAARITQVHLPWFLKNGTFVYFHPKTSLGKIRNGFCGSGIQIGHSKNVLFHYPMVEASVGKIWKVGSNLHGGPGFNCFFFTHMSNAWNHVGYLCGVHKPFHHVTAHGFFSMSVPGWLDSLYVV